MRVAQVRAAEVLEDAISRRVQRVHATMAGLCVPSDPPRRLKGGVAAVEWRQQRLGTRCYLEVKNGVDGTATSRDGALG